jgi:hypothetical protein
MKEQAADWQGHAVTLTARLVSRLLWSTASIDVFVDGNCVLRTGGQLKVRSTCVGKFGLDGASHDVELTWNKGSLFSFPVELRIDGILVVQQRVSTKHWPLAFWPVYLGLVLAICVRIARGG